MKKIILILLILLFSISTSGCNSYLENNYNEYILCIDGIEYIKYGDGYRGYMSPHLKTDKFDNPKVVKCEVK